MHLDDATNSSNDGGRAVLILEADARTLATMAEAEAAVECEIDAAYNEHRVSRSRVR